MTAARTGRVEAVRALLAHGADVNAKEPLRGQTALMWAAAENNTDVVTRAGRGRAPTSRPRSNGGFTPFLFAVRARPHRRRASAARARRRRQRGDSDACAMAGRHAARGARRSAARRAAAAAGAAADARAGLQHRPARPRHGHAPAPARSQIADHQRAFRARRRTARPRRRPEHQRRRAGRRCTSWPGPGGRRFSTGCRRPCRPGSLDSLDAREEAAGEGREPQRADDARAERRRAQRPEPHRLDAVPPGGEAWRHPVHAAAARERRRSVDHHRRRRNAADGGRRRRHLAGRRERRHQRRGVRGGQDLLRGRQRRQRRRRQRLHGAPWRRAPRLQRDRPVCSSRKARSWTSSTRSAGRRGSSPTACSTRTPTTAASRRPRCCSSSAPTRRWASAVPKICRRRKHQNWQADPNGVGLATTVFRRRNATTKLEDSKKTPSHSSRLRVCRGCIWFYRADVDAGGLADLEQGEVDRVRHRLVPGVARVQVIARIVRGQEFLRIARIARDLVEIDHRVVGVAGPNPAVDGLPLRFADLGVIRGAVERRQRRAEDLQAPARARAR